MGEYVFPGALGVTEYWQLITTCMCANLPQKLKSGSLTNRNLEKWSLVCQKQFEIWAPYSSCGSKKFRCQIDQILIVSGIQMFGIRAPTVLCRTTLSNSIKC